MLAAALTLSGCGWRLRGVQDIPISSIYVNLGENSAIGASISRNLRALTNVKVVDKKDEAEAIFELISTDRGTAVLAYNSEGRARIYSLRLTNVFRLIHQDGTDILPPTTVSATREIIKDEGDYNGVANEERLLYEDMQQQLIHQMVSRLSHISPEAMDNLRKNH